jgi:hypothetical protein
MLINPPPSLDEILERSDQARGRKARWPVPLPSARYAGLSEQDETFWQAARRLAPLLAPWTFATRFVAAVKSVRASELSSKQRYEEALRLFRTLPPHLRESMSGKAFEIQQLSLLGWSNETIDHVNRFVESYGFSPPRTEDARYLLHYVKWCGRIAMCDIADIETPFPAAFVADPTEVNLTQVTPYRKRAFPFTIHPDWPKDEA